MKAGPSSWAAIAVLALGCVPADAGYSDVRRLTSERIGRDLRWNARHAGAPDQRVRELSSKPLDVGAAVQLALLNNASLQAAFEELGVARGRLVEARRLPNPALDLELRFHLKGDERANVALQGTFDLTDLGFLAARSGAARAELDAAQLSVAGQALDVAFETRAAFYDYQAAAQTLELRRSVLEALRASLEVARALHEAGNATDLSLANERVLYEEARLAFTRTESALAAQRERLNALLGVWGEGATWTVETRLEDPSLEPLPLAELESRAVERSIDLALIERRFTAAAKAANLATARGWVPELRAGVVAEREHDDELGWTFGPVVGLELPLFYQGQGEAAAAQARARREQQLHADTAVRVRAAARAAAAQLGAAAKSVSYYKETLLPLRQQILDATQLEYNAMSTGVFQLLSAKREQIEAARAYVELLRDYWLLRAQVDQLLAGRLPPVALSAASSAGGEPSRDSGGASGAH